MALPPLAFEQADYDAVAVALASEDRRARFNLADAERSPYVLRAIRLLSALNIARTHRGGGR